MDHLVIEVGITNRLINVDHLVIEVGITNRLIN